MSRRIPRLEVIEAFLEAARAPNFRTAAERCALSSTAFTRRIQAFTAFVGQDVFERQVGGMRLTPLGREYAEALEPVYREMRRVALELTVKKGQQTVTVSLSHSLAVGWLIPRLADFRARHPNIDVSIQTERTACIVRRGDADVGLCAFDVDVAGLHVQPLLDVRVFPVATAHIAAGVAERADKLSEHRLLGLSHHPNLWSWWAERSGVACGPVDESARFDMAHALYESAAGGFGIAIGLNVLVGPHLETGRLANLGFPAVSYPGGYRLVTRSQRVRNLSVAAFRSWLVAQACSSPRSRLPHARAIADPTCVGGLDHNAASSNL